MASGTQYVTHNPPFKHITAPRTVAPHKAGKRCQGRFVVLTTNPLHCRAVALPSRHPPLRVCVASMNPVKIQAVQDAFITLFPDQMVEMVSS